MSKQGSVKKFMKRLDSVFEERLQTRLDELKEEENKLKANFTSKEKELKEKFELQTKKEAEVLRVKVINQERFKAKTEMEEIRSALIDEVFQNVLEKGKKTVQTKQYIDFVKTNMPESKDIVVTADSDSFSKHFKGKVNVDKGITGVKVSDGKVTYDFTIEGLLDSKIETMRCKVDEILFG